MPKRPARSHDVSPLLDSQPQTPSSITISPTEAQNLVSTAFDFVLTIGMDAVIRVVSARSGSVLDFLPEELDGVTTTDLIAPSEGRDVLDQVLGTSGTWSSPLELRFRTRAGAWAIIEAVLAPGERDPESILLGCRDVSERRQREDHWRTLEKAIQTTQVGITVTDQTGTIVYINRAEADMHGYSPVELIGKPGNTLAPPHLREETYHAWTRPTWARETENLHRDGTTYPVLLWSDVVTNQFGERIGYVTCSRNIAEEKRVESALRSIEAHFRGSFEDAPIGMAVIGTDGAMIRVNSALCKLTGFPAQTLLAGNIRALFHPEDIDFLDELLDIHRERTSRAKPAEIRLVSEDGDTIWTLSTSSPVRQAGDGLPHIVVQFLDVSLRRHAEESLRRSEERIANIFSVAPDAIISLTDEHEISFFNAAAEEMFGYSAAEVLGEKFEMLLPGGTDPGADSAVETQLLQAGDRCCGIAVRQNGEHFPFEASVSRPFGPDEELYTIVLRDVAERKAAEDSLRQTQHELSSLVRASPLAIVSTDLEGRVTLWNPAAERILGWSAAEVLGKRNPSLTGQAANRGSRDRTLSEEEAKPRDRRRRTKSGAWIDVRIAEAELTNVEGQLSGYMAVFSDTSRERMLERERENLLREEMSARTKAESAQRQSDFLAEAIATLDNGFSTDISASYVTLARLVIPFLADCCTVDEITPDGELRRVAAVHRDPDRESEIPGPKGSPAERVRQEQSPLFIPDVLGSRTISGTAEPIEGFLNDVGALSLAAVPLVARGRMLGILTLIRTSESAVFYSEDDLQLILKLASNAALMVDNECLYHEAEASARSRDEVLAVVSHDLRNPLSAIQISLRATLRSWPPLGSGEEERQQLLVAARSAERMKRLIRDLLDVARIETGRLTLDPLPQHVSDLLYETAELNRPVTETQQVELKVLVHDDLPLVNADFHRVLQILGNLIENAVRFTPPGGTVTVAAEERDEMIEFSVSDTGRGITPAELPRLFDRVRPRGEGSGGRTGLGLTIAKGLVEGHGGTIWATSAPGVGTKVCFTLPVVRMERVVFPPFSDPAGLT